MNTIFLTGPASRSYEKPIDVETFTKKAQAILQDEKIKKTMTVISFVAPLAAGPMASATGRVLPAVAKGLKYAPHAINCVMALTQA